MTNAESEPSRPLPGSSTPRTPVAAKALIAILIILLIVLGMENVMARRSGVISYLASLNTQKGGMEKESKPVSATGAKRKVKVGSDLKLCLKTQFEKYGSDLDSTAISPLLGQNSSSFPPVILIAASNAGYKYGSAWQKHRTQEQAPFVLFKARGKLRNGELAPHYARVPALLACVSCLPLARTLVYTDMDTLVDLSKIPELTKSTSRPFTISYKKEMRKTVFRTNWIVVRRNHPDVENFLLTWFYNGRHVRLQDQTVLNDLYSRKLWFRQAINGVQVSKVKHIELRHCFSDIKNRRECMMSLTLDHFLKRRSKRAS